jgi:alkaline phosphatase
VWGLIGAALLALLTTGLSAATPESAKPKYVFLFIGDGMGPAQVEITDAYLRNRALATPAATPSTRSYGLTFKTFPVESRSTTHCFGGHVTDSAAAGTALSTGYKTSNGRLGIDEQGRRLTSIAALAHADGYKVGILSTSKSNHATPASFYAHQLSRDSYPEISMDLAESGYDFFGGLAGLEANSTRGDVMDALKRNGYRIVNGVAEIPALKDYVGKTIVFEPGTLGGNDSLAKLTAEAIRQLTNPKGFFMMVEGSAIDWAGHGNDVMGVVNETIGMDLAIDQALAFYRQHPTETLIVVTADHETGGLSLTKDYGLRVVALGSRPIAADALTGQIDAFLGRGEAERSFDALLMLIGQAVPMLKDTLTDDEKASLRQAYDAALLPADKRPGNVRSITAVVISMIDARMGVQWSTGGHTATPVPVFAIGAGAEHFVGSMDNVDIPRRMMTLMGLSAAEPVATPEKK